MPAGAGQRADCGIQKIYFRKEDAAVLKEIAIFFYHKWDNTRKRVDYVDLRDTALHIFGKTMQPWNQIDGQSRFVVENYRKALDAPGEWLLQQDGYLYYIPLPGETPEDVRCVVPVIDQFLVLKGSENRPVQHITFKQLRFEVAAWNMPRLGFDAAQAAAAMPATVMLVIRQFP